MLAFTQRAHHAPALAFDIILCLGTESTKKDVVMRAKLMKKTTTKQFADAGHFSTTHYAAKFIFSFYKF